MIEVELKAQISSTLLPKLQQKLQDLHFDGTVHNKDIYYDTRDFKLLQQAVFVRKRNGEKLEFKFNENIVKVHGQATERTFPLFPEISQQAEAMNALFARFLPQWKAQTTVETAINANELIELALIDNKREEYSQEGLYVSIDHVEDLGNYLEVEARYEEGTDSGAAEARIREFITDLDIKHIGVGYVELWLQKYNPEAYKLGRYHL